MKVHKAIYLLPGLSLLLFGWLGVHMFRAAYEAHSAQAWPTVNGTVVKSGWRRHAGKGCQFSLDLRYSYSVSGVAYAGTNYRFGGECGESVMQIAAAHPVGTDVLVHYKPEVPEQSVISAGDLSGNTKLGLALAPVMVVLSVGLIWHFRRLA